MPLPLLFPALWPLLGTLQRGFPRQERRSDFHPTNFKSLDTNHSIPERCLRHNLLFLSYSPVTPPSWISTKPHFQITHYKLLYISMIMHSKRFQIDGKSSSFIQCFYLGTSREPSEATVIQKGDEVQMLEIEEWERKLIDRFKALYCRDLWMFILATPVYSMDDKIKMKWSQLNVISQYGWVFNVYTKD